MPWGYPYPNADCGCCGGSTSTEQRIVATYKRTNAGHHGSVPSVFTATVVNGSWTTPENTVGSDSVFAIDTWNALLGTAGDILDLTGFDFGIPVGSTILGVTVRILRKASSTGDCKDLTVQLIKGGTPSGDNKASATPYASAQETSGVYGGDADLWSLSLSQSDVSASNFGVRIQPQTTAVIGTKTVSIDYVTIEIEFTYPNYSNVTCYDGSFNVLWDFDYGLIAGVPPFSADESYTMSNPLIDADGNVYAKGSIRTNNPTLPRVFKATVKKIDSTGVEVWSWDSGDCASSTTGDGPNNAYPILEPPICFDLSGNIVVHHNPTASGDYMMTLLDPATGTPISQFTWYPGDPSPLSDDAQLIFPVVGVGVDSSGNIYTTRNTGSLSGFLYKADSSGNYIARIGSSGEYGTLIVDSVANVIYQMVYNSVSFDTLPILRKRLCSTLAIVYSKTCFDVAPLVQASSSSFGSTLTYLLGWNSTIGEVQLWSSLFDSTNHLLVQSCRFGAGGTLTWAAQVIIPYYMNTSLAASRLSFEWHAIDEITDEGVMLSGGGHPVATLTAPWDYRGIIKVNGSSGSFISSGFIRKAYHLSTQGLTGGVAIKTITP